MKGLAHVHSAGRAGRMVQVNDIVNAESLEQWLQDLPFDEDENRRIAVAIAHRAAMRLLPVYWNLIASDDDLLEVLRMNLISGVAANMPIPEIRETINRAPDKVKSAEVDFDFFIEIQ